MSAFLEDRIDPHASTSAGSSGKTKYRPEIDGLRAFAVVAVIINHFNKELLPSGYLGVDIFFVISGYVITSSLANRESKSFGDFIIGFCQRRIKRLVPSLVVFVLITSALIYLFNPDPAKVIESGVASLFGLSNIYLFKQSTDYFAQSTELNAFAHTWSLGVEEQFYLLFPFLIWFSGFGRQARNGARILFFWIGALAVASLAGFIYLYQVNQPAAYFLMPPRFWEMAAGCLIFIGYQKRQKIEQSLERVPPLLVVAAMLGVMFLPVVAAVAATMAIVILSAILIACLKKGTAAYRLFTLEKVVYIGLISYSLYLWHWGVLSISRWTIGVHWWTVPFQILILRILAHGSYRFIEVKARAGGCLTSRWMTISLGLMALVGSSGLLIGIQKILAGSGLHYDLNKDQGLIVGTRVNRQNCHLKPLVYEVEEVKVCSVESSNTRRRLIIIGDSHANAVVPMYSNVDIRSRFNLVTSTRPGGRFGFESHEGYSKAGLSRLNSDREKNLLPLARNGDLVVIVNHFLSDLDPLYPRPNTSMVDSFRRREILAGVVQRLSRVGSVLKGRGATLIVFAPLPNFHHDSSDFNLSNCRNSKYWQRSLACRESRVDRSQMLNRVSEVVNALRSGEKQGNYTIFDGFNATCPARLRECSTELQVSSSRRIFLYRDMDHLSGDGAQYLSKYFVRFLRQAYLLDG